MRLRIISFLPLLLCTVLLQAQNTWNNVSESSIPRNGERRIVPERYRTVRFDANELQAVLSVCSAGQAITLTLPMPDGTLSRFRLVPATVMAADLQARYPEIQCFTGYGLDDPGARLKCDQTPWGFHAMITSVRHSPVFIDPYSLGDAANSVVYFKKDYRKRSNEPYFCSTEGLAPDMAYTNGPAVASRTDGQLRTYRLALACTGEYAAFHGGTKPLALAAMVTSINRINSVFENEFSVSLQLIANTDTLIFLSANDDPYTNNDGGIMLGQNKTACNMLIGSAFYDMGHVFSTGGGGIANLACICTGNKAMGVTGLDAPIGDAFDIDYVAHEMGHQFSGNHTQNNDCQRAYSSVEPGSASTIMGYAGICSPDVQPHSDAYFHGINVQEIVSFITDGAGDGCPVKTPNGNSAPLINGGADYTIPKATPFVLTALGSDADGDILSYCWEQMDADPGPQPPQTTNTLGPLFRTFNPGLSPQRYFPDIQDVVNNTSSTWEALPGVARAMNFRVTARDNHVGGGTTAQDDILLTVAGNAGPFRVTSPDNSVVWKAGEFQVITWDVANTNKAPVNCQLVNILLSTDGGYTYPYTLAGGVPNSGKYCVTAPDIATTTGRIRVEAVGNIFFDLSNANFSIQAPDQPGFSLCPGEFGAQICLPANYTTTISTSAQLGFNSPIYFSATGVPAGATVSFSPNPAQPGTDVVWSIDLPAGLPQGATAIEIQATADNLSESTVSTLSLVSNDFSALALNSPANSENGLPQGVVLRWNGVPDADTYEVQLAASPSFEAGAILYSKLNILVDTLKVPLLLPKSQLYFWRIRPVNECGPGPWSEPFVFVTVVESCVVRSAGDLPKNITANGTPTIESIITVNAGGVISDVNVAKIQGQHEFFKDLQATLISPQGTQVLLFKDKCGNFNGNFNFALDDAAANAIPCPPANNGLAYNAQNPLAIFIGENSTGDWKLRIKDNVIGSGGTLTDFKLEFCASVSLQAPFLVNNNVLQLAPGDNALIQNSLLLTDDANNGPDQLTYTLMTVPQNGLLQKYGGAEMKPGDTFTQTDLNNGALRYFDYGLNAGTDDFRFAVTDGEGGLVASTFLIDPFLVSTRTPASGISFSIAPNPANETVRLAFSEALSSEARLSLVNSAGQQIRHWTAASGTASLQLDLAGLAAGVYALSVQQEKGTGVRKLVKN